jgi:hypothetical protein
MAARPDGRVRGRLAAGAPVLAAAALCGLVLLDGYGRIEHPRVRPAPVARMAVADPQLHAPSDARRDRLYMYWSIAGFPHS